MSASLLNAAVIAAQILLVLAMSFSLFRARCSSPAPLSNSFTAPSSRNGIWPKGWRAR